ncbi:APC family permease [Anaerotignum sp.]|uniref:APC family permease n=1 Tax=Anaerotignum sp. TaxID=2039241 RepID=UPI0028B25990|nr:APC family permease [Anaerotignum sp.]
MSDKEMNVEGIAGLKKYDVKTMGVVFMIFSLVAAGGFGAEEMISSTGPGLSLILLIILPFIWAMPISNTCSELGAILPEEGGVYVWAQKAFGEFWGFQVGWWNTVGFYVSNSIYVVLAAGYAKQFIPMTATAELAFKIGVVIIFLIINLMGIAEVSKVNSILTVTILLVFALVAVVGIINWNTNPMEPIIPNDVSLFEGITGGLSIAVWMYCGYECIGTVAGELKNPQVIPKALLIALPIVALTYILPLLGGLASLGEGNWANWAVDGGLDGTSFGYSDVLTTYLGPIWGYIFLVIAMLSQLAMYNMYIASGSRGFFVMADDNLFPKFMCKVSRKKGVPHVSIIILSIAILILMNFDFETLVMCDVVFMMAMYITIVLALVKLRKVYPIEERRKQGLFVIPGGKVGLTLSVISPIIIAVATLVLNGTDYLLVGIIAIGSGVIAYVIIKTLQGGLAVKDPIGHPLNPRTKLAVGDTFRVGLFSFLIGTLGFLGQFVLVWYEGDWGPAYYLEEGTGGLFSNFWGMIDVLKWGGAIVLIFGIFLMIISKKIEPQNEKKDAELDSISI